MSDEQRERGLTLLGKLFGGPVGEGPAIPEPLGRYTVEHLFGEVWQQSLESETLLSVWLSLMFKLL